MEPSLNQPEVGALPPESKPATGGEQTPTTSPERSTEAPRFGPERVAQPEQAQPAQAAVPAPIPATPPAEPAQASTHPSDDNDDSSQLAADDVDVIEKQWVNKAKAVIARTKDDPHAQEAAFEKLQAEYLKKRYGKDLGAAA